MAVVFFFVLSGVLITYLLLIEKQTTRINIKKFYWKRVLRILPLYYTVLLLSFFLFNSHPFFSWPHFTDNINLAANPFLYILLLVLVCPNIVLSNVSSIGYASHTWSIGVEEQFYLFWPWLLKAKNYAFYILVIILSIYLFQAGLLEALVDRLDRFHILSKDSFFSRTISTIDTSFFGSHSLKIDAMATGSIAAFLVVKNQKSVLDLLFSKKFQYVTYLLLFVILIFQGYVSYQYYSIIFSIIILNLGFNPGTILSFDNRVLNYLGKISYGIYMLHMFTIIPSIYLITNVLSLPVKIWTVSITSIISLIASITLASISYHFFERHFLTLRR